MKTLTLILCLLVCRPAWGVVDPHRPPFHSLYLDAHAKAVAAPVLPPSPPPKPTFAMLVFAIVMLIVGGIIIVRLLQFLRDHFPPPPTGTNAPGTNTQITSYLVPDNETVWKDPGCTNCTATFIINYTVSPTNVEPLACAFWSADQGLTTPQMADALKTNYGLTLTLDPGVQYASNRVVVDKIPYTIVYTNGVLKVTDDGPSRTVVVERAVDNGWLPVITNVFSCRFTNCSMMDPNAPVSGAFYRARLLP